MKYKKIALIGMMGTGKSTIADALSNKTNIPVLDMDFLFEKKYNILIKDFFKKYGENEFRKCESELLSEITIKENFILSTGGGVILSDKNREILFNKDIYTIYLSAKADTIYKRIKNDTSRPLLQVDNPENEIEKILKQREQFYQMANTTIKTDNKEINEIVKEIECIL